MEWVEYPDLLDHIAAADVCLGIFGTSEKAASVIPNKVFQALSAGKPVITRDSPAIRELLAEAPYAVQLVPANDPSALAAAVMRLAKHRSVGQSEKNHDLAAHFNEAAIGRQLLEILLPVTSDPLE